MDTDDEAYLLRNMLCRLGLTWEDLKDDQVRLGCANVITETFDAEEIAAAEKMLVFYLQCRGIALSLTSALRNIDTLKTQTERTMNAILMMQDDRFTNLQNSVKQFGHYAYLGFLDHGQKSENSIRACYNRPSILKLATAFDPGWQHRRRMFFFDLPEELDTLEKFVRHDQSLLEGMYPPPHEIEEGSPRAKTSLHSEGRFQLCFITFVI